MTTVLPGTTTRISRRADVHEEKTAGVLSGTLEDAHNYNNDRHRYIQVSQHSSSTDSQK